MEILLIHTALGIHLCNPARDYALKTRLGGETKESYVIMHKACAKETICMKKELYTPRINLVWDFTPTWPQFGCLWTMASLRKPPLSLQTKTQSSPICSAKTNQDLHFAKISGKGLGSFQGR